MERLVKQSQKAPSPLAMQGDSHLISKLKPKIRIVHLYAPEVIKTDVANFRTLVQRLTGKPTEKKSGQRKPTSTKSQESSRTTKSTTESEDVSQSSGCFKMIKDEEQEEAMWGGDSSTCFFNGLGDLDEFIQGLNDFPLLPINTSRMDLFGESQLC